MRKKQEISGLEFSEYDYLEMLLQNVSSREYQPMDPEEKNGRAFGEVIHEGMNSGFHPLL